MDKKPTLSHIAFTIAVIALMIVVPIVGCAVADPRPPAEQEQQFEIDDLICEDDDHHLEPECQGVPATPKATVKPTPKPAATTKPATTTSRTLAGISPADAGRDRPTTKTRR